jgi:hypothetical protein
VLIEDGSEHTAEWAIRRALEYLDGEDPEHPCRLCTATPCESCAEDAAAWMILSRSIEGRRRG